MSTHPTHPEFPPYRPPSEADSVLVRVTRGCHWNRCGFCGMYKDQRFERRGYDEVIEDIARWRALVPHARSVFLADADSLRHPRLAEITAAVKATFPEAERITSYTRLTTLAVMDAGGLHALREAGLDRLHAGLESGSDRIRDRVRKALPREHALEGSRRALEAGFELSLYILSGLAGEEDALEHGAESGRLVAEIWPHFLRLRSLVVVPGAPLYEELQAGDFRPATPVTRLREVRAMLAELIPRAGLPPAHDLEVCSDHFTNIVWAGKRRIYAGIAGRLPREHDALLAVVDEALLQAGDGETATDPTLLALQGRQWNM